MDVDKKNLSERDICTKYITPAILKAGWNLNSQFREEVYFTKGRVIVRGKLVSRGEAKKADYMLYYKPNLPIGVIEAKDNKHSLGHGMPQALEYAEMLNVPFVFSSNGDGFLFHDRTGLSDKVEQEISLNEFPSPESLWKKYCEWKGLEDPHQKKIVEQGYYSDGGEKTPRYYQLNAINRTIEAIAKGQDRILLVMATGTGKTFTAFQIIWRLWKSKTKKRILFLADRNILVDQTKTNDFKPFGSAMTKITNRKIDTSYEIYLALYQAITGTEETSNIYKEFSRDFFDLIVIDECHRGSAAEDSAWREILEYFNSATQIGLTATPKETKYISNIHYFGEPVYTYSLKQGIEDGYLAPYKVVRIDIDKDLGGWRPPKGKKDKYGHEIEDRIYNQKDFDRTLVLEKRTSLVARRVSEFLKEVNRFHKTIIFCEDIDHAERMRQELVNENSDLASDNARYIVRITGDNDEGKKELENFIDPEKTYPVIATTSKLMTTGVDAQTCKLIVLDRRVESMTEFKQIVGRGTRINEEYDKYFFTIIDFRKVSEKFADPDFDGEPVQIYEPKEGESIVLPDVIENQDAHEGDLIEDDEIIFGSTKETKKRNKYYVGDVPVSVISERVQYYSKDGKLVTESLKDFTRKSIRKDYSSLDNFLRKWSSEERKTVVIKELEEQGVFFEALMEEVGRDYDPFDLICHIAFDQPPLTRKERAENVRKRNYFAKYSGKAGELLEILLEKYQDAGVENLENPSILKVQPINKLGAPLQIVNEFFGGEKAYKEAIIDLEKEIYKAG